MGDEAPLFRRLGSLQRYVADGLRDPEPERAVVERLARFMDASVAVLEPDGTASVCTGKAPFATLFERSTAIRWSRPRSTAGARSPRRSRRATRTRTAGSCSPVRSSRFAGPLARRAAETTAPLLVAMDQLKALARAQELAERAALLDEALRGGGHRRARAPAPPSSGSTSPRRCAWCSSATRSALAGRPHLLIRRASRSCRATSTGVAAAGHRPARSRTSPARRSRCATRSSRRARGVVSYEELDLAHAAALRHRRRGGSSRASSGSSSILHEHPPLHEALVAYFDHDLDVPATAAALHLHPNSLRYRLQRLEELLGCSLKRPATIAELHIALSGIQECAPRASEIPRWSCRGRPRQPARRTFDEGERACWTTS